MYKAKYFCLSACFCDTIFLPFWCSWILMMLLKPLVYPQSQDFLLHMPVSNGNMGQDVATEDRLATAVPTLPMLPAPDLTAPMPADTVCSCEACNERRSVQIHYLPINKMSFSFVSFSITCPKQQGGLSRVRQRGTAASKPLVRGPLHGPLCIPSSGDATSRRPRSTFGKGQGGHEGPGGSV